MTAPRLSVKEVAERLGVGERTILRLIKGNELTAYRVGGVWRVAEEDLESYLSRARHGSQGANND